MESNNTIISFIAKHSYLDADDIEGNTLSFATRDNGNVGEEEYGEEDYTHAITLKSKLLNEFKNITVEIDTIDEWVILTIQKG